MKHIPRNPIVAMDLVSVRSRRITDDSLQFNSDELHGMISSVDKQPTLEKAPQVKANPSKQERIILRSDILVETEPAQLQF